MNQIVIETNRYEKLKVNMSLFCNDKRRTDGYVWNVSRVCYKVSSVSRRQLVATPVTWIKPCDEKHWGSRFRTLLSDLYFSDDNNNVPAGKPGHDIHKIRQLISMVFERLCTKRRPDMTHKECRLILADETFETACFRTAIGRHSTEEAERYAGRHFPEFFQNKTKYCRAKSCKSRPSYRFDRCKVLCAAQCFRKYHS